jgi:hypothetical protein
MRQKVGIKKVLTGALFLALIAAGAVSASTVAGREPLQVVSSSTSTLTSTTTTTTTVATTTTTTTTTPKKITICHHARAKSGAVKHVTIRINRRAWTAHQKHGDSIGACNTATAKKFHSRAAHIKKWHKKAKKKG